MDEESQNQVNESGSSPAPAATDAEGGAERVCATLTLKRDGVETEDVFTLTSPAVVGRFDPSVGPVDVDLSPLPEASYVSRRHARITYEAGHWRIEDLGSSNGTFIKREDDDYERVDSAELTHETEIALGSARFVFRTGGMTSGPLPGEVAESEAFTPE
jgi:pSer/pThr/pTyr-binding forkhead associated (FHA) protein